MKSNDLSLAIAYTPDSDDAFVYYALEHGCVTLRGHSLTFVQDDIHTLNQQSLAGRYIAQGISRSIFDKNISISRLLGRADTRPTFQNIPPTRSHAAAFRFIDLLISYSSQKGLEDSRYTNRKAQN